MLEKEVKGRGLQRPRPRPDPELLGGVRSLVADEEPRLGPFGGPHPPTPWMEMAIRRSRSRFHHPCFSLRSLISTKKKPNQDEEVIEKERWYLDRELRERLKW